MEAGSHVSGSSSKDTVGAALIVLGLVAAAVDIFFRPFLFTPIAALLMLIGIGISHKHRRFGATAAIVIAICFIVGAAAAVWSSRALY